MADYEKKIKAGLKMRLALRKPLGMGGRPQVSGSAAAAVPNCQRRSERRAFSFHVQGGGKRSGANQAWDLVWKQEVHGGWSLAGQDGRGLGSHSDTLPELKDSWNFFKNVGHTKLNYA